MASNRPVVLVTGGGTGVGRACCLGFAERGYDVVVNFSRSREEAEQTLVDVQSRGVDGMLAACDVSDDSRVRQMIDSIGERFGRLDVLVNNAAMTHFIPLSDLDEMSEDKWDRILAVNLKGAFFCARASRNWLSDSPQAAIVNVSSVAGLGGSGSCIAYAASKGAMSTMTKSLAKALAPKIRVNAVLPGPIDSRWIREGNNDWDLTEMTADYPIPRPSQPSDVADCVIFLATTPQMVTGQLLVVDGGRTM
ncbi:MAG: SDR family oxidoreductase [Planctomycetales bacterium]|nr:SDR family oxidoreductase [Planctomycetales bacterium]